MNNKLNNNKIIFQIIPNTGINDHFDYLIIPNQQLNIGNIVIIPFGNKKIKGTIINQVTNSNFTKLKAIDSHIQPFKIPDKTLNFLDFFSKYNLIKRGIAYKMLTQYADQLSTNIALISLADINQKINEKRQKLIDYLKDDNQVEFNEITNKLNLSRNYINSQVKSNFLKITHKTKSFNFPNQDFKFFPCQLSDLQQISLAKLQDNFNKNPQQIALLNGATGSGKTEIYLEYVRQKIEKNQGQILILVPEIILTKQLAEKILERFGINVPIWHSNTNKKTKSEIFHGINQNKIQIVIGTRSALFLPFANLKLIIIDEEHDSSYKQEDNGCYHARDMAVARAKFEKSEVILTSATPSIESLVNCDLGKYLKIDLFERYNHSKMPIIEIIDMRQEKLKRNKFISQTALKHIRHSLDKNEQALIYMNRRGFAFIKICNGCKYQFQCPNCAINLVEHKKSNKLICHHCDYKIENPTHCIKCDSDDLISYGPGIERIEAEAKEYFPDKNIVTISSEASEKDFEEIIKKIKAKSIDILIGTQIIAKGHHFPELTNVTVIDGDLNSGEINDLRASERLYQLLNQISGRAGREAKQGYVYVQSFDPDNDILQAIKSYDNKRLIEIEKTNRKQFDLPPFSRFIAIIISSSYENNAKEAANQIAFNLPQYKNMEILGPIPSPIYFLRKKYRYRILIKIDNKTNFQSILKNFFEEFKLNSNISVKIDVDPYNFF